MELKAQGTIEYLVILAVIVVVSLVVVSLMTSSVAPVQGISSGVSKLRTQTQPIAIVDATVNPDGNVYLKLGNNIGENVEIKTITVEGEVVSPDKFVEVGGEQGFVLPTSIRCVEGVPTTIEVLIEYDTQVSHLQDYPDKIIVNCETTIIEDSTVVVTDLDSQPPVINLLGPSNGSNSDADGYVNFSFSVSDSSTISSCELLIGGDVNATDTDGNYDSFTKLLYTNSQTYNWDIRCTDEFSNAGTSVEGPYSITSIGPTYALIGTSQELNDVRNVLDGNYALTLDVNMYTDTHSGGTYWNGGVGWNSIDNFTGAFDGQNYTISGLFINSPGGNVGLFGNTAQGSSVSNINLADFNVTGGGFFSGGLVGSSFGDVNNVHISNSIIHSTFAGNSFAGGLAGKQNYGTVFRSSSSATVTALSSVAGGLIGGMNNSAVVRESFATGNVSVSANDGDNVGGLVGNVWNASVIDSYAVGDVDAATGCSGDCRNIGGLVGDFGNGVQITNSYSLGDAHAKSNFASIPVGGLVGAINGCCAPGSVSNSFSTGQATFTGSGSGAIGGLIGSATGTIDNSFWDTNKSGLSVMCGAGTVCDDLNSISTSSYFYLLGNAPMNQWNFTSVWDSVCSGIGYPPLVWEGITDTGDCRT